MIREQEYIRQTEELVKFYQNKENLPVKRYILACYSYINELRNIDVMELFTEIEYEKAFRKVLSMVEENFRPDTFNSSFTQLQDTLVHYLDDEFLVYMIGVEYQLKKRIKWDILIDLQYKYAMVRIKWLCENGFNEDFEQFAINNIPLVELFKTKV